MSTSISNAEPGPGTDAGADLRADAGLEPARDPHAAEAAAVAARLGVDPARGLTAEEATERLARSGPNEIRSERRSSLPAMVLDAATEPFVLLLLVAGLLAVAVGEVRDGLLVLVGLLPIVGADIVTEYRGERALEELRAAAAPVAQVRRDGRVTEIAARALVPGDVVLLRAGDVVPADLRLIRVEGGLFDRSVLTGESLPEAGSVAPDAPGAQLADRRAVAFAGTSVARGRAEGIVVATGANTEMGHIASALGGEKRRRSPLQRELDRLVRILLVAAVSLIVITTGLGFVRGQSLGAIVLAGISAAIAAIPEEPPVLLAVVLGLGAFRLLRRGVLVRRLSAQETLGAVDLILTDKTGTLTENRLALADVLTPDGPVTDPEGRATLVAEALCAEDDAWSGEAGIALGSFTKALVAAVEGGGAAAPSVLAARSLVERTSVTDERPYSVTRTCDHPGAPITTLALGAPEAVLGLLEPADAALAGRWSSLVERLAESGARLLLLARRDEGLPWRPRALLAFADPVRSDAPAALRMARDAGIQIVMVTGDHPRTALAIARAAGLGARHAVTGPELAAWDDARLRAELGSLDVVARALPSDKLRLVDAARAAGRTVAVTGDGVNDAPALQHADVAVAMGSGVAVAREASDMVLGDDAFPTLMFGLREGRRIVANVQKGLVFLISTHVALLGFILLATLAGYGQPLLPLQILWMELFIDLSTSVAFEREPEEPDAMRQPPRPRDEALLTGPLLARLSAAGLFTAVAALVVMSTSGGEHARWLAYTILVVGQVVRAYANRSLRRPVTTLPRNTFLAIACLVAIGVQLVIPAVPALADAFRATSLDAAELALVALLALAPAVLAEVVRWRTGRVWVA